VKCSLVSIRLGVPWLPRSSSPGRVAYRELGSGPPLVLITGFSATMDDWSPGFVDSLAVDHRVIELDNAGVGRTMAVMPLRPAAAPPAEAC
jgi:pimeloyl-ACP methyl ester carboxylesterase